MQDDEGAQYTYKAESKSYSHDFVLEEFTLGRVAGIKLIVFTSIACCCHGNLSARKKKNNKNQILLSPIHDSTQASPLPSTEERS